MNALTKEPPWRTKCREVIRPFVPQAALEMLLDLQETYQFNLTITGHRSSKLGDYRSPHPKQPNHAITVNGSLNPYGFLITYLHEIAHLIVWEKHKNRVLPHGPEWKSAFRSVAQPFLQSDIFPDKLKIDLDTYLQNPAASSCGDTNLLRSIKEFDPHKTLTVADIAHNELFGIPPRIFRKGELKLKRYRCFDVVNKRWFAIHPLAEVKQIPENVLQQLRDLKLI